MTDDIDYVNGDKYGVHAHINACGTGELTAFIDPSEVKTLTLIKDDEARYYDLLEKPTHDLRCSFCGSTREEVGYLVKSPLGPCICDECAIQVIARLVREDT